MNKQEVIDEIEDAIPDFILNDFQRGKETGLTYALELVKELDVPEKPVVPQYVADWIEDNREALEEYVYSNVQIALPRIQDDNPMHDWLNGKGIGIIVDCIRNGYEIEKEKLYTARLKLITAKKYSYINKEKEKNRLFIYDLDTLNGMYQTHFTQAELEELGVWNNPAFEVEEMEK